MDPGLLATFFVIAFIGSMMSGMLGIGGAIINYPMLLYVPPLLGFAGLSAFHVSGIVAFQIFFASLGGIWAYRKGGLINKQLIFSMGASILAGSFLGALGSGFLSEEAINFVYGILAAIAAIMMFIPKRGTNETDSGQLTFNRGLAAGLAFFVGVGAGIVGAGGSFLLVPIMLVLLKIPTRITVATSLAVTFLSSIGSASGKVMTGQVPLIPALVVVAASLIASPLGAAIGKRINTKVLQIILAVFILATAVKIWFSLID
ncbi:MAG TPA: sulfite exporter TauE/SafE family protein [Bacillales bacterium]|nr:sulfite exporter TauE/SafE family protein [Bacillales bacterium]